MKAENLTLEDRVKKGDLVKIGEVGFRAFTVLYKDIYYYDSDKGIGIRHHLVKDLEEDKIVCEEVWVIGTKNKIPIEDFKRMYKLGNSFISGTTPILQELKFTFSVLTVIPYLYGITKLIIRNKKIDKYGMERITKPVAKYEKDSQLIW